MSEFEHPNCRRAWVPSADWTKVNVICDPAGDLREGVWVLALGRPLTAHERPLIRAGLSPFDFEILSEHD